MRRQQMEVHETVVVCVLRVFATSFSDTKVRDSRIRERPGRSIKLCRYDRNLVVCETVEHATQFITLLKTNLIQNLLSPDFSHILPLLVCSWPLPFLSTEISRKGEFAPELIVSDTFNQFTTPPRGPPGSPDGAE